MDGAASAAAGNSAATTIAKRGARPSSARRGSMGHGVRVTASLGAPACAHSRRFFQPFSANFDGSMPRGVTQDALFDGALTLFQPARGYRVNIDALLLAAFAARGRRARRAIDLGAGVGAVGLSLLYLRAAA